MDFCHVRFVTVLHAKYIHYAGMFFGVLIAFLVGSTLIRILNSVSLLNNEIRDVNSWSRNLNCAWPWHWGNSWLGFRITQNKILCCWKLKIESHFTLSVNLSHLHPQFFWQFSEEICWGWLTKPLRESTRACIV